jgi:hypothetical protein
MIHKPDPVDLRRTTMKLSREFSDEQEAQAQELALQTRGYRAWRNRKRDGSWQVFWFEH